MKRAAAFVAALLLFGGAVRADTLFFKDGLQLSGSRVEVLRETESGVDVKVSLGTITIPWHRIQRERVDIEFDTRMANMKADGRDTPRELFEFATLLVRHDMLSEAANVCGQILQKERVSEDILLGVARQMEEQQQWKHAKTALEMVLRVNPSRQDVVRWLDRVAKNAAEAEPPPEKPAEGQPDKPADKPPAAQPEKPPEKQPEKPPEPPKVIEGLEAEEDWVIEPWGNAGSVSVLPQGPDKNKVLSVSYGSTDKDKAAVRLSGAWDLTDRKTLVFDIWNAAQSSIGLSVGFNTMPGWQFLESTAKSIRPSQKQWATVKFSLTAKRFKSAETKWRNTGELANRDNVKQIILMVYNTSKDGVVYFDNIRFVDEEAGE